MILQSNIGVQSRGETIAGLWIEPEADGSTAALAYAELAGWPLLDAPPCAGLYLRCDRRGLALASAQKPAPILVRSSLAAGPNGWRLRRASIGAEPLARACGLRRGRPIEVVDATAGLGRDGMLLAHLGAAVTMLERDAAVSALLADGLRRASHTADLSDTVKRIARLQVDAVEWLAAAARPEVVYIDAMFALEHAAGAAGKEMRLLHRLLGDPGDAAALVDMARLRATRAVVVKRRRRAAPLTGTPHHSLQGRVIRFDVYRPCATRRGWQRCREV